MENFSILEEIALIEQEQIDFLTLILDLLLLSLTKSMKIMWANEKLPSALCSWPKGFQRRRWITTRVGFVIG